MKLNPLVQMMAMLPILGLPATTALHASDLSIYSPNSGGKTSILLMLDTSGSMGISSLVLPNNNPLGSPGDVAPQYANTNTPMCSRVDVDEGGVFHQWAYNAIDRRVGSETNGRSSFKKTVSINGQTIPYYLRGCGTATLDANGNMVESDSGKFDRLSRLKEALIQLLADMDPNTKIDDSVAIGLGNFSAKTSLTVGTTTNKLVDGHSGRIITPVAALTAAQRESLIRELASIVSVDTTTNQDGTSNANLKLSSSNYPDIFKASSGTPAAHAYAEAAAYMMGTTTGQDTDLPTRTTILYDGYSVMQKTNDKTKQVYYMCVDLGTERPTALGATVMACDNEWNKSATQWYDSANKRMGSTIKIYKPNGLGGWIPVTPEALKAEVGDMNDLWETHAKLPAGWRYGGWMKLNHEPMDIEPIGGKVWGNHGASNLVSYRSSPFTIKSGVIGKTVTQGFQACPSGYSVMSGWAPLCEKSGTFSRSATATEKRDKKCYAPGDGSTSPLPGARNVQGNPHEETFNMRETNYVSSGKNESNSTCVQYRSAVNRPWGNIVTEQVGPIDNLYGGFAYSSSSTKNGTNYQAGGSTSQCDGNGIYFLTDGAPNSTKNTMAQAIMNRTLGSYTFSGVPTGGLASPLVQASVFENETGGWEYIGAYAQKLRNRRNSADTQKNPADMNIKTAVVGFGASFSGIPKKTDGTYNCEAVRESNTNAYNACKWGSSEYGDGGFYYAENVNDIKQSIKDFVEKVSVPFTGTSMGSVTVPRDPLDQTQIMTEGFFPMISPFDDSTAASNQKSLIWIGNLKKYRIIDGTLKDASGNAIYSTVGNQQVINSSAKDLWSYAPSSDDHSSVSSGGSWNKIPVPSSLINNSDPSNATSVRNVFTLDGTSLKKITKTNLATNYTGTDALNDHATGISISQRYSLLNYLGYSVTPPATIPTALTTENIASVAIGVPQSPYRFLGGVVHSTPIVATKEAKIGTDTNSVSSRTEYVVYGSMEGGLHIVDASTGEEKSVFVPKEILNNQHASLVSKDAKGSGLVYGVDAPWAVDNQFKIKNTTMSGVTTTTYEARILNIYGGLRMGGNAIYGLNIDNPESPDLLFHKTPLDSDFTEMRQIWSKPTIAEIRYKGARKRVLIFGGGYDNTVYESATATNPASSAGNALYVIDATNGNLIWKITNAGTAGAKLTVNTDVKYSVVAQPVTRDYDSDGLADMIYFADLGGQIFRVDLNNLAQMSSTVDKNIAVRVKRIANLATSTFTPRFYDRLTTAVFGNGTERFVLVTAGSGNRSYPLNSNTAPDKIYGILDYDAAKNGIEKESYSGAFSLEATEANLYNRGNLGKGSTTVNGLSSVNSKLTDPIAAQMNSTGTYRGWYFNLKSVEDTSSAYYSKSYEESQLVQGDLFVNLYDPKASLSGTNTGCGGGVQGLSTVHRICAPFGNCAAYIKTDFQGIVGPTLGGLTNPARTTQLIGPIAPSGEKCIGKCDTDNTTLTDQNLKKYSQARTIRPTRWFEW